MSVLHVDNRPTYSHTAQLVGGKRKREKERENWKCTFSTTDQVIVNHEGHVSAKSVQNKSIIMKRKKHKPAVKQSKTNLCKKTKQINEWIGNLNKLLKKLR